MIIHPPTIDIERDEVVASARIEFESPVADMPERLWFRFPASDRDRLSDRADGFLSAMLLLAMKHGEDVCVRGVVSPRLLSGVMEYQRVFHQWFPRIYRIADIRCDSVSPPSRKTTNGDVLCAFSGGVDSLYTLWAHLEADSTDEHAAITHGVFAHGFDIPLEDEARFPVARRAYQELFRRLGRRLLTASTNAQQFGTRIHWGIFHGSVLIGLAHILGRRACRFYVPASHTYTTLMPWGSDPRIDHLLSTETMEVVHDGAALTRVEKTEILARWSETYTTLRVCLGTDGMNNCCRCEKCVRTMAALRMCGALENYRTFPRPLENKYIRRCRYGSASEFAYPNEVIRRAYHARRWDMVLNFGFAVTSSHLLRLWRQGARLPRRTFRHILKG